MKKLLSVLLAATMAASLLAGCGGSSNQTAPPAVAEAPAAEAPAAEAPAAAEPAAEAPANADLKVGVFYYQYADVYISTVRASMDEQLTAAGIDFTNFDGENNQTRQSEQIQTAATQGINMFVVNIVETTAPDAAQNAVEVAREVGATIVFFNREVEDSVVNSYDKCAFVGTNAPEAGYLQGEMIGQFLLDNYDDVDINGDGVISYVMLKGQEGNAEADARTKYGVEYADNILTDAGKPALSFYDSANTQKYLLDQDGAWSPKWGNEYLVTILSQYNEANGNMVELVIANNDGMAEGAVTGLQSAGYNLGSADSRTIPVFGVDAVDTAKQLISENKMTGTVMQDAVGMASYIMTLVKNIAAGSELLDNTSDYNIDEGVAKLRVPYAPYFG